MSKLPGGLSIVLPAYNEEHNIGKTLNSILEYIPKITEDFEIIVVNDGSTDNTADILNDFASRHEQIIGIAHEKNRGYGAALKSGFEKVAKEFIFFMDSDGQFDITDLTKLLYFIGEYDIVSGIRMERKDPLLRDINGTIFNFAMKFIFGIPITDVDCAFKLFRRDVLKRINLCTNGALINTEIFIKAKRNHKRIMLVGVEHYPRLMGKQSGASLKVIIRAIGEIFILMRNLKEERSPQ